MVSGSVLLSQCIERSDEIRTDVAGEHAPTAGNVGSASIYACLTTAFQDVTCMKEYFWHSLMYLFRFLADWRRYVNWIVVAMQ